MLGKFLTHTYGPIHFNTRFLPFIEHNYKVLHNFTYIVGNYELYEPYKNLLTILNPKEFTKNHWTLNIEVANIFTETNSKKFVTNFNKHCVEERKLLPFLLSRFHLLDCLQQNILNVTYTQTNTWFTNKQEVIDEYFDKIPTGTFHMPLFNHTWEKENEPYPFHMAMGDRVEKTINLLKEKFPGILFPTDFYYFDGFHMGMHFNNKNEMQLFFDIVDYITYLLYTEGDLYNLLFTPSGYTRCEWYFGYVMRVFELNFNYSVKNYNNYWNNQTLGKHLSIPHDTWHNCGIRSNWDVLYGFELDNTIRTVKQFINRNVNALHKYHQDHGMYLNYKITKDNVILTHINL